MADKWMDERDRQMRERDWRRSERYGRGPDRGDDYRGGRGGEDRSFGGDDRVFGERETGANYGRGGGVTPGGGYGGGQGYGRGAGGGRSNAGYGGRPSWQDRDFGGTSPAFSSEEDSRGYGYRDDDGRQGSRAYGRPYGRPQYGAAGGTGGYDYERGYGDAARRDERTDRTERFEDAGRSAGEFLHRAGERVASWFSSEDRDGYGPDRGHRGRGPKGYKRSDERIDEEAHERLTDDHWLDATHISLTVSSGEVTLSGTVDSREAKHRAERIVEDIAGVNHVQNNLRIDRGEGLTGSSRSFSGSVLDAQMGQDDPSANGSGGAGAGQSTVGRKS